MVKDSNIAINLGESKELRLQIQADGCVFTNVDIRDPSSDTAVFHLKICILDLNPSYLENLQTCYKIEGSGKKRRIIAEGIKECLVINPGASNQISAVVAEQEIYSFNFDTTLTLVLDENSVSPDNGKVLFNLSCGSIQIPLGISDDTVKPSKLTGVKAFKQKNERQRGFEYRSGKIIMGTTPYYAVGGFEENLKCESFIVEKQALYVVKNLNGEYNSQEIEIPEDVRDAYINFLSIFKTADSYLVWLIMTKIYVKRLKIML